MNEGKKEELGRDDDRREDRRNRQPRTKRNPRGAGRPSREVVAARKIEEFTENPERYIIDRAPEWAKHYINGRYNRDETGGKGDPKGNDKRIFKGLARGILTTVGLKEKEIDKMNIDAIDELAEILINELKPSSSPVIWKWIAPMASIIFWYQYVETRFIEDILTQRQWDSLSKSTQKNYFHVAQVGDKIHAYKWRYPRVLHTIENIIKVLLRMITGYMNFFTGFQESWEDMIDTLKEVERDKLIDAGFIIPLEEQGYIYDDPEELLPDPEEPTTADDGTWDLLTKRVYAIAFKESWNEVLIWLYDATSNKTFLQSKEEFFICEIEHNLVNWNRLRNRDFQPIIGDQSINNHEAPYFWFVASTLTWRWLQGAPWYKPPIEAPEDVQGIEAPETEGSFEPDIKFT